MKLCFCRFLLAAAVIVLAIFWWPAAWAKWVIVAAAAILAIMSLFYQTCCCRSMKKIEPGTQKTWARNKYPVPLLFAKGAIYLFFLKFFPSPVPRSFSPGIFGSYIQKSIISRPAPLLSLLSPTQVWNFSPYRSAMLTSVSMRTWPIAWKSHFRGGTLTWGRSTPYPHGEKSVFSWLILPFLDNLWPYLIKGVSRGHHVPEMWFWDRGDVDQETYKMH